MSQLNRPFYRPEVKSKIGDYIRGKISAQSLMHPSRINTKPIDKRQYTLNVPTSFNYSNFSKNEFHTYQKRTRRPPLKDYIEGRVKLSDMISPSRITHIPKERKYNHDVRSYAQEANEAAKARFKVPFEENTKFNESINNNRNTKTPNGQWCLTSYHTPLQNQSGPTKTELTLIPLRTHNNRTNGNRRKVMCKIKRVQRGNALTNGEDVTEERIIEVPEALLKDKRNVPKFLMDHYNIPCSVSNGKTGSVRKPLAILNATDNTGRKTNETDNSDEEPHLKVFSDSNTAEGEDKGEDALILDVRNSKETNRDHNVPTEQGDYNNSTTYIFEFFEESDAKSAIIEEVEDENVHPQNNEKSYFNRNQRGTYCYDGHQSGRYSNYEDYKSQISLQRELLDLHRGMLKCDRNVMVVEHSVNQVTASLNSIQNIQNQEIKPIIMDTKNECNALKGQMQGLQSENQRLKSSLRMLRKKTVDYEKLIYFISQANSSKMQELETKLQTITQAQVKSIEMQNVYNKNMLEITHQMKRTYSELDSRLCCSSIKSSKNSNSSDVTNTDII